MDSGLTGLQKRKIYRSLMILAVSLENKKATVDLRNETSVSGKIAHVDQYMNFTFEDAAFVEYDGHYHYFMRMFVPARMIRDIILPDNIPIIDLINDMLPKKREKVHPQKKPMTFKRRRALNKQADDMKLLKEFRESKK